MRNKKKLRDLIQISNRVTFFYGVVIGVVVIMFSKLISLNPAEIKFANNSSSIIEVTKDDTYVLRVPKYWGVSLFKWHPKGSLRTTNRLFARLGFQH